ncbi:MAG TPA: ATP phosphoribosyltransferase regulatory subunit [Thermoanaerobaculia bacterium]|nr:ATP phosphoribosyltransferase regulatory subunit [Thermoanaerobaculia bacterium]
MAAKQTYPTGVRPLLLEEAARRRRIETQFVDTLEGAGFAEVVLPIIDYVDPYSSLVDRTKARQSYRFTDREGDLVAIRSDFTPMVARALAPSLDTAALPLRVFYRGDVIRCEASRLGANRELFQIGAEIVGDGSVDADVEVLRLAASIARSFGIAPLVVYNDVAIAESLGADAREALVTKRLPRLAPPLVGRLVDGTATLHDVRGYPPARDAAERLTAIGAALDDAAFALHLDDIDITSGYYTGLRFRLYSADSRRCIAQGGRYDSLYGRFGTPAPAVGFTFTIDDLD